MQSVRDEPNGVQARLCSAFSPYIQYNGDSERYGMRSPEMTDGKYPPIEQLLPHRPPMILIDRLVQTHGSKTVCEVVIGPHSMFLQAAGVPAFVGIEYMAQTVAAHGGYQSHLEGQPIVVGLLLGTRRLETTCQFFELGQILHIEVTHIWGQHELMRFRCAITNAVSDTRLQ